jgi:glycosyltransferase involved in cell wall biosynthesis
MIVKDEQSVIERLLRSVSPFIGSYLIVDTGSTDDTPLIIQRHMQDQGIGGEIHFRDWVNFGHNRQEALDLAVTRISPQWLLFIDADEELRWTDTDWYKKLTPGMSYRLEKQHGSLRYALSNLVWCEGSEWCWNGAVHEYLDAKPALPLFETVKNVWIHSHVGEGARSLGLSDREKFLKDADLLEASLLKDPSNARDQFYLAQSYRDAGELQRAYQHYGQRVDMGGWEEEVYVAQCERANLAIRLEMDHSVITQEHLKAYSLRPSRAEALWQLAAYCREQGRYAEGYLYSKVGKDIKVPPDILFVQYEIYEWRLLDEFSICAYWIGQYEEALTACEKVLSDSRYDPNQLDRLQTNLRFCQEKMGLPLLT